MPLSLCQFAHDKLAMEDEGVRTHRSFTEFFLVTNTATQEVPGGAESIGSSRKRVFSQMLTELKNNRLKMSATDGGAQDRLRKTLRKLEANNKVPALKV